MAKATDEFIWVEFSGVIVGEDLRRVQFSGEQAEGGMAPFWMSRKGVRRILYSNGTWSTKVQRGRGVCVVEMATWAAREVGLG